MTKYFARFDHATKGPFTLTQLVEAGVRPSTYVWCKGMDDWQRAEDIADICRAMRCTLAGLPIPGEEPTPQQKSNPESQQSAADNLSLRNFYGIPEPDIKIDYDVKPQGISIMMAVVLSICCFPITGMVALWFAYKFQSLWKESEQPAIDPQTRHTLRVKAYEKARVYRMMIGITFSIGLIMMGIAVSSKM